MSFLGPVFLRQVVLCGTALVLAWQFQIWMLHPLNLQHEDFIRQRTELQNNLRSAHEKLVAIKDSEVKVGEARATLNRLLGQHRDTPTMVSFPNEMEAHFSHFGFSSAVVRFVTAREDRDLPGYQRVYWSIGLPIPRTDRNVAGLLLTLSDLEKQDRFIKVIDFALQPDAEDPSLRTASINLMILSEK